MAELDPETTLRITRAIKAPPEKIFDAFIVPELRMQWWRSKAEAQCTLCEIDAQVGGHYRINMLVPGAEYIVVGTFQELARPEKMVFTWSWEIPAGGVKESLVTVELKVTDEHNTELTLIHERLGSPEMRDLHAERWDGYLAALTGLVEATA